VWHADSVRAVRTIPLRGMQKSGATERVTDGVRELGPPASTRGRRPHIHFKVSAPGHKRSRTQNLPAMVGRICPVSTGHRIGKRNR